MATAPRIKSLEYTDPEIERSKVFNPLKTSNATNISVDIEKKQHRNPKDVIRRFEEEKAYGLGRRRTRRTIKVKKSRKIKKTRKH